MPAPTSPPFSSREDTEISDQARERKLGDSLRAVLGEQAGATRYENYRREMRRGNRRADGPRPREYDANGFPVPHPNPSFVERVARLLNPL